MADDVSEFDLLVEEAAALGMAGGVPSVERVDVPLADPAGAHVSALLWARDPRVTFLHGAGLNAHTWDGTILSLGQPAIAVDLPGHGESSWRDDFDYAARTNASAVAAALDAIAPGVPQVVVGHSLGGLTAIALLESRPELIERLILVDASPGLRAEDAQQVLAFLGGPMVFESREQIVEFAIAAGIGADREALMRGVILNTRIREDGAVVFKHHFGSAPPGASLDLDFTSLWPALERSEVPTLLVRASDGFLPPDVVDEFRTRVPRAEVIEVTSGHTVQEQVPLELAAIITRAIG